jgi:polysaccharide chain length determinant protein (PEP-CTERM system associated)
MDNAPAFHPLDYVSVLQRRMWWLITPVVLAIVIGTALIALLPRQYQASATIGVSLPAMTGQVVSGESNRVSSEERLRNINQVLTSPVVLERVAREEGLDKTMSLQAAMQKLQKNLKPTIAPSDPHLSPNSIEQFMINYTDSTPQVTQRVTNRISDAFVEETSRKRSLRAEETSAFIGRQLAASQTRLNDLEGRLRAAKESFMGALPEQTNANLTMATGLQQQLESTVNAMRGEQDRLSVIERQIDTMTSTTAEGGAAAGGFATVSPAAQRLATVERELATALKTYTDKHPEIVRLREELAVAKADAAAESSKPEAQRVATLRVDPAYRSLTNDREQARLRINEFQRQQANIQSQISMYRARVESAPRVEQQIASLEREYDLEKQQYAGLNTKLRAAEMQENVERNQGGERFTVLSRAPLPESPSSPNTPRLMLVTLLGGLCLGAALALGREYLDRSIHDARALNDLDLPVLGEIPRIANA